MDGVWEMTVELIRCKRTNPHYQDIRNRHYVANNGCHGQQLHYLVNHIEKGRKQIENFNESAIATKMMNLYKKLYKE